MSDATHTRESDTRKCQGIEASMREIAKAHIGVAYHEMDYLHCTLVLNGLRAAYELGRASVSTPIPLTPSDEMVEDRLAKIFGAADVYDFARLDTWIPESGHGQFWKHVFFEVRAALNLMGGKK